MHRCYISTWSSTAGLAGIAAHADTIRTKISVRVAHYQYIRNANYRKAIFLSLLKEAAGWLTSNVAGCTTVTRGCSVSEYEQ